MNCGQNPCKVFVRKRNNEQNNIHVDNKAYEKTSHKIDEVFPNISKQAKRISENNRNCKRMPEELETLRNQLMERKRIFEKKEERTQERLRNKSKNHFRNDD